MLLPHEIQAYNKAKATAIFERFESVDQQEANQSLQKSEDQFWTKSDLISYRNDLFKGLDNGDLTAVDLSKAEEELLSLRKEVRTINGMSQTVFVK
jgi:uncharacterized protein YccT (UPF0319 family)